MKDQVSDKDFFLSTHAAATRQIEAEFAHLDQYIASTFPASDPLRQEITRFITKGGKRFRPSMSLAVAQSFGQPAVQPHLALETFHKFILAHDDVIDRDTMRYGAPTVHAKMADLCTNPQDKDHFGNSLAIVAGDLMEAATHRIILNSGLSADITLALERLICLAVEEVTYGWYDQFLMDYERLDSAHLSLERIEESIVWVTGKYSIKMPLHFGYAAAGRELPDGLDAFADAAGLLFQLGDDLLGLFGDPADTGKSNAGDITQGKKTIPMWLAYTLAAPADKATLREVVGKQTASADEVAEVRAIVERSGAMQRSQEMLAEYEKQCLDHLEAVELPVDLRRYLAGFVQFLVTRDR